MKYSNNDLYDGEWKKGLKDGLGEYRYCNGDKYVGYWKEDKKSGEGTLSMSTGDEYKGGWFDGKKEGKGVYHFGNSDVYEGRNVWIQGISRAELGKGMASISGTITATTKDSGRTTR